MRKYIAEFLGTTIFILLGCGVASVTDNVLMIAMAFGVGIMVSYYIFSNISGGHFNPAVTLSFLFTGKIRYLEAIMYIIFQVVGGFFAILLLRLMLGPDIGYGVNYVRGGYEIYQGLIFEFIFSFIFVLTVLVISYKNSYKQVSGLVIGLTLTVMYLLGTPITGTGLNPARSIAPAIVSFNITAISELWIFVFVPIVGGILASIFWEEILLKKK